jgi:geranylgeranyl diphosphate synthase type II
MSEKTATLTPNLVPELLAEYGAVTRLALRGCLPQGEPNRYLYDLLADYPERGGKMMRPCICIATAKAFGARLEDSVQSAVAIELLHNALLIHDDIQDESTERRGQPTLHLSHGVPLAINAGDSLTLASLVPLIENRRLLGPRLASLILEDAMTMARETAEGQALELGWRRDNRVDIDESDYLTMVLKKTSWLGMIFPLRVGALIGTGGDADLEPFVRLGFFIGAAFQIQDDLLNFVADARYGKELNGDIWEGKRTLMLIHLLKQADSNERTRLIEILRIERDARTQAQVAWVRDRMDFYGSVEHAKAVAHGMAGAALYEYSRIFAAVPESRDKQFIRGLITWVFERTQRNTEPDQNSESIH